MKKSIVFILLAAMLFTVSCESKDAAVPETAAASEETGETEKESAEAVEETAGESGTVPYAEEKGLRFAKFPELSMDFDLAIFDKDTFEEIDSEDCHIIDKDKADLSFLNLAYWPSEKQGYTTARLTCIADVTFNTHISTDGDEITYYEFPDVSVFDYYTGKYIPTFEESISANLTGETDASKETKTLIDYDGNSWELTANDEHTYSVYRKLTAFTDQTHGDIETMESVVYSTYVTYPDGYDGLSFAINPKMTYPSTHDKEKMKESFEGNKKNENIGKDILSVFEDYSKDDILFCSLKDPGSLTVDHYDSKAEAEEEIPAYLNRKGLTEFNEIDEAKEFSLPSELYLFAEDGKLLTENTARIDSAMSDYSITGVKTEAADEGETKVTVIYDLKGNVEMHFNPDFYGDYNYQDNSPAAQLFNGKTGVNYNGKYDFPRYDSTWGDWKGPQGADITFKQDHDVTADFTVPTDDLKDMVVLFGDRTTSDHYQFRLSELIEKFK